MKYDIITVGSAVIDAFVETKLREKNREMILPVGHKLLVDHLGFATGGGGTNTAATFSKMGLKTGFLGKLGRDENAKVILKELKEKKVDFLGVQGREPTGYSVVIDSKYRDRTILTFRGANENLRFEELKKSKLDTGWFYFSTMNEKSLETQVKLSEIARKNGARIAYNPGAHIISAEREKVLRILKRCEVLILNEIEAENLVGTNDEEAFDKIRKLGPKVVAITYGENGNKVYDGNFLYRSDVNNVKVVERTGAGDAFAAGFLTAYIKLNDVEKAVKIGSANAESVIQKKGAKNGILYWGEALRKMNSIRVSSKRI